VSSESNSLENSIKDLDSEDVQIRKAAAENLGEYEEGIEPLINALRDENPDVRFQAATSLGNICKNAVEPLIKALKNDEEGNIKKYAAFALKNIGDPSVTHDLIGVLNDEDFAVRKFAVKALGEIGDEKAVEPLIESLNDEDWGVRVATLKALGDIGDERAVDPIKKARRAAKGDKDFKKVANKALKKIK